jgi:hypothetical protein
VLNTVFILSENVQDQGQIIGRIWPFLEQSVNRTAYMGKAEQNR